MKKNMKPLLMMRTRGISGPYFAKHKGWNGVVKSLGNAFSAGISGEDIIFYDTFTGAVDIQLVSISHKNNIEIDESGAGWKGASNIRIDTDGESCHCQFANKWVNMETPGDTTFKSSLGIKVTTDKTVFNNNSFIIRRQVTSDSDNNEVSAAIANNIDESITISIHTIKLGVKVLIPGTELTLTSEGNINANTNGDVYKDFSFTDDGDKVTLTCINTGQSVSATNAEIDSNGTGESLPPSKYSGFGSVQEGRDSKFDYFKVVRL